MVTIKTPAASFVKFDSSESYTHCLYGDIRFCLPVYDPDDHAFQFVLETSTSEEADALSSIGNTSVSLGLVNNIGTLLISFDADQPERFRISPKQILYNWKAGFPGFETVVEVGQCFKVQVSVGMDRFYSNCFERIGDDCFTSIIEYGNDDNSFGFNYCASGVIDPDVVETCEPTEISFTNSSFLSIPYTASLKAAYGTTPTVQVWIYDEAGELVNAGIQATLDAYPPNILNIDLGGPASGLIVIK